MQVRANDIAFLAMGAALSAASACTARQGPSQQLQSPNGAYLATVSGLSPAPRLPLIETVTDLTITRTRPEALRRTDHVELFRADFLEDSFLDRYSPPKWLLENTICFPWAGVKRSTVTDHLEVRNQSGREIAYLKISTLDILVAMDIKPGTVLIFKTTGQFASDEPFVGAVGRFADGAIVPFDSRSFATVAPDGASYTIDIRADGRLNIERTLSRKGV